MSDLVRVERKGRCAWVTLDRPPLNLFTPELIAAVRETFDTLARDAGVGAAVLTGAGRAFTAGMQVQVLRDLTPASAKALITSLHEAIHAVHEAPFPTIAMVNGPCLGAGFELAMACDIRTAADGARLGLPEVKVGVPSVIEAALLPALVGPGRAAEILLTGEPVGAPQAFDWGRVNRGAHPRLRPQCHSPPERADRPVAKRGSVLGHPLRQQCLRPELRHRRTPR